MDAMIHAARQNLGAGCVARRPERVSSSHGMPHGGIVLRGAMSGVGPHARQRPGLEGCSRPKRRHADAATQAERACMHVSAAPPIDGCLRTFVVTSRATNKQQLAAQAQEGCGRGRGENEIATTHSRSMDPLERQGTPTRSRTRSWRGGD